jgi:phosphatidylinositol-4,5-bisphosphate 3-kinase
LGSGSIQIYDEHGFLKSGLQEVYIWPFFENDLKVPSTAPFHRRNSTDPNEEFDKNNYGIIYLEFPKFKNDLIQTYKTPESYSDFLMIKNKTFKQNKYKIVQFSKFYNNALINTDNIVKNIFKSFYNFDDNNEKIFNDSSNEKEETTFFLDKNELESLLKILTIEPLKKITNKERELILNSRDYISTISSKLELFLRCINWFDPIQADIARTYLNKWTKIDILDAIGLLDARFPNIYVREYALTIINDSTDDLKDLYMLQIIYGLMYEPYYESYLTDFIIENSLKRPYFASKFIMMSKLLKDHPMFTEKLCVIISHVLMMSGTKLIINLEKTLKTAKLFLFISKRSKELKEKNKWDKNDLNKNIKLELNNLFLTKDKISYLLNQKKIQNVEDGSKNDDNSNERENDDQTKQNEIENIINEKVNSLIPEYQEFIQGTFLDGSIPAFSSFYFSDVNFDNMRAQDSKMVPIDYTFYPTEGNVRDFIGKNNPLSNVKSFINIFFKNGDDLRQDHLALQAIKTMDRLWLENDLDLKVFGYSVLPAGQKYGFMEKCEALPYNSVQTGKSISGIFDRELIKKYFDKKAEEIADSLPLNSNSNKQEVIDEIKLKQVDNFVRSLAGYCVATCVLGIADRHSDNIMIQDNGIFLHIDYGHILGNFKEKLGFKREKSKFVLDQTMMNFCKHYNMEEEFKYFCVRAYNILRKNANRLLNLFIIMSSSGMPELYSLNNIKYFIDMLKLDKKNDEDAGNYFLCLINQSKNDKYRYFDNIFHNINHLKVGEKKQCKDNKKNLEKIGDTLVLKKKIEKKN